MLACRHGHGHLKLKLSTFSALIDQCLYLNPHNAFLSAEAIHALLIKLAFQRHTFLANRLLSLYSRSGAVDRALRVFQEIPIKNTFSYNTLLGALWKAGHVELAHHLFDEMPQRDSVSWNSMISGYAASGMVEKAWAFLRQMQEDGVRASAFTFSIAASFVTSERHCKQVHAAVVRNCFISLNTVVGNSLIDMYGRIGFVDYACHVFHGIEQPDILSWNSIISVCGRLGHEDRALDWFKLMLVSVFLPDEFTMSAVINAFGDLGDIPKGEQLLARCFSLGCIANSIVCSAVIDMYSKCGRLDDAFQLFEEMTVWDSALCNSMISGYAQNGLVLEALKLFVLALQKEIRPTEFTFSSILGSSSCFGLMEQGMQIHCYAFKSGFEAEMVVASALLDMYMKSGSLDSAIRVFSSMGAKDLVSWNAMIMGLAQHGQGVEALKMFRQLQDHGLQPDRITLLGALSACRYEALITEGNALFSSMVEKYGIVRDIEHYALMVDMFGQAGMLEKAINIIETMPFKPDESVWGLLLEACRIHGDLVFAEMVAKKALELEPRFALPYVVLAKIYETRGKWESMVRLQRIMKDRCVIKVRGHSWISIKNEIFVAKSRQILHFEGETIYTILNLLLLDMKRQGYVPEQHEIFENGEE
ncbi:TPR-like protein [Dioscorea alata]|uniref:TPR-like protein n=1 Tax=Dioscorea alata TaxID=55571 RepID=A0ACB7USW0_DIOAL|nr:TPR-like protein [Dioscorea alata]